MARRPQTQRLDIWMNGLPVGYWEKSREGDRLSYLGEWIEDEQGRPLSLSMPFTPGNQPYRGDVVSAFFDNLLPDSDAIRRRLAQRHRTGSTNAFDLLMALGRDSSARSSSFRPMSNPPISTTFLARHYPISRSRSCCAMPPQRRRSATTITVRI
jgi:serine/threonine-protein kinase HipA